jgi:hypothetical protein
MKNHRSHRQRQCLAALVFIGMALVASQAISGERPLPQFDSGSNGSDGALVLTEPGTILFDPAEFGMDPDGDGIIHFTTIEIGAGVTVKLSASVFGSKPVIWLAQGEVLIAGTIDLNGENGHLEGLPFPQPAVAGAGGFDGGIGGNATHPATPGCGPGGGAPARADCPRAVDPRFIGGASAGHAASGVWDLSDDNSTVLCEGGAPYGNSFLFPLVGGSGGGGSQDRGAGRGGGGGAGGGAILIASSEVIRFGGANFGERGQIVANGGSGFASGSGGAIRLVAPAIRGFPDLSASGVGAVNGINSGGVGSSHGRIRIEGFELTADFRVELHHGTSGHPVPDGLPSFSTPGPVFAPVPAPVVRISHVAEMPVPSNALGNPLRPDLTVAAAKTALVDIEGENVPPGALVELSVVSENGPFQRVQGTLDGTLARSTARLTVPLPQGLSRFCVVARWESAAK